MLRKITRLFPLVLSVLLLTVSITVIARAQDYFVEGEIRWSNRFGVVPARPGDNRAAAAPCSIFSVVALDARSKRPVAYTDQGAAPFQFSFPQNVTYICRYSLKVPADRDLYIMATMGNVLYLPKTDRDPYLITSPWIAEGGRVNQPWAGSERGFTGATYVTFRSGDTDRRKTVDFRMTYVDSETSGIDIPTFFAGAWQGKIGSTGMQLILQQAGNLVTGQLIFNAQLALRGGSVGGNTLRFEVVRRGQLTSGGQLLPDQFVGTGELVMDPGGQSFRGTILGAPASGTLVGR